MTRRLIAATPWSKRFVGTARGEPASTTEDGLLSLCALVQGTNVCLQVELV